MRFKRFESTGEWRSTPSDTRMGWTSDSTSNRIFFARYGQTTSRQNHRWSYPTFSVDPKDMPESLRSDPSADRVTSGIFSLFSKILKEAAERYQYDAINHEIFERVISDMEELGEQEDEFDTITVYLIEGGPLKISGHGGSAIVTTREVMLTMLTSSPDTIRRIAEGKHGDSDIDSVIRSLMKSGEPADE